MTTRPTDPGIIVICFDLTGDDAKQFRLMAKEGKMPNYSTLAKSLIRDVIADDRVAHEHDPRGGA